MGTVVFNPCYSAPSFFSTSSKFSKQPKLGASIFFLKGIADGPRVAFPRFKVSCKILDGNKGHRPPKKISLRTQTQQVKESDIHALVKQVQSSLRKEAPNNKKTPKEEATSSSPNKKRSEPGPPEKKSPAASFWENHLLSRQQVLAEKGNGALTELLKTRKEKILNKASGLDSVLAQPKKKNQATAADVEKSQPVVDLRSTRPRSKFVKRSPIPRPPVREEKIEVSEEVAVVVEAKTEEPELLPTLEKMKVTELRLLAKSRGVKVHSKLKKKELLEILKSQVHETSES